MDRTEYLNLCKKVSVITPQVSDYLVEYEGITYYPQSYQLSFDNGNAIHTAIIHNFYCDSCGNEDVLYEYEGGEYCIECIKDMLTVVEGSEE